MRRREERSVTDHIDTRQRRHLLLAWLEAIRENIEDSTHGPGRQR
jgi:hypothetical protein